MAEPGPLVAELLLDAGIEPEQERAIVETFGELGVAARARVLPVHRGAADLPWLVLAMLPLQAFLSTLGAGLASDASQAVKRLVSRAHRARPDAAPARRVLVLQDTATRLQVTLEADLPADAYEALLKLDLSKFRHGPVHYDRHRRAWRSELDEGLGT